MIAIVDRYDIDGFVAPQPISSDAQNDCYTEALYGLERRGNLTAAEKEYAELLTVLIEAYEEKNYPIRATKPVEILAELMAANDLKQKDLVPYLGSESMVSMVLSGKRELSKYHIVRLSKRFRVSPELFLPRLGRAKAAHRKR